MISPIFYLILRCSTSHLLLTEKEFPHLPVLFVIDGLIGVPAAVSKRIVAATVGVLQTVFLYWYFAVERPQRIVVCVFIRWTVVHKSCTNKRLQDIKEGKKNNKKTAKKHEDSFDFKNKFIQLHYKGAKNDNEKKKSRFTTLL